MRMRKRMTGLLLVLVMLLGMIPVSANAEDGLVQGLYLTTIDPAARSLAQDRTTRSL